MAHGFPLPQLHQKLAINCAVNPCTALLGCLNHEYSDSAWGRQLVLGVCEEMVEVYGTELLAVASARELADLVLQVRGHGVSVREVGEGCKPPRGSTAWRHCGYSMSWLS